MSAAEARRQDMPPAGGYRPINYKRVPAASYFNGRALILGYLGMTAGSFYFYYLTCKQRHFEDVEMRSGRFAVHPILVAERDREYLKQLRRNRDEEAKLMANVEGWEVGTYYGQPRFITEPKDKLHEPTAEGYFVHADPKAYHKRVSTKFWS